MQLLALGIAARERLTDLRILRAHRALSEHRSGGVGVRLLKLGLLIRRKQPTNLHEIRMVQNVTITAEIASQVVILLKQVLNHLLLHIFWQFCDVNLRSLNFHAHRILCVLSLIRCGGLIHLLGFRGRILKSIRMALLDRRLLALVPYLAGVEIAWLRPQRHQHVAVHHFPLLRFRILFLLALLFQKAVLLLNLTMQS